MANHKSPLTTTLLELKVGQEFIYPHPRAFAPANLIYPRVHRIAKQTGHKFECVRIGDNTFHIRRTA